MGSFIKQWDVLSGEIFKLFVFLHWKFSGPLPGPILLKQRLLHIWGKILEHKSWNSGSLSILFIIPSSIRSWTSFTLTISHIEHLIRSSILSFYSWVIFLLIPSIKWIWDKFPVLGWYSYLSNIQLDIGYGDEELL